MNGLFDNAVQSIVLGIEDYQTDEPKRMLSAVRNLYAGVLLLGKEVLVRRAPNVMPDVLLAARVKPKPDGDGGIVHVPDGSRTVDFETLGKRLRDFELDIDLKHMKKLNAIRNDVEHRSTDQSPEALRESIAAVFPTVLQLFRYAGEEPSQALGRAWHEILRARDIYEAEAKACRDTVRAIQWESTIMPELVLRCPKCNSKLIEQLDATNHDPRSMRCSCRACGSELEEPEEVIEATLSNHFAADAYFAKKEGFVGPLGSCPECGRETYLWGREEGGCAVCGAVLGMCFRCAEQLTPWDVSGDDSHYCSYCYHMMHKD